MTGMLTIDDVNAANIPHLEMLPPEAAIAVSDAHRACVRVLLGMWACL